jgi:hypothetical protein
MHVYTYIHTHEHDAPGANEHFRESDALALATTHASVIGQHNITKCTIRSSLASLAQQTPRTPMRDNRCALDWPGSKLGGFPRSHPLILATPHRSMASPTGVSRVCRMPNARMSTMTCRGAIAWLATWMAHGNIHGTKPLSFRMTQHAKRLTCKMAMKTRYAKMRQHADACAP